MPTAIDATKLPPHDIFYMEGAGGCEERNAADQPARSPEPTPSCFAFEEERGEQWSGAGSATPAIKDRRPTL